MVCLSSDAFEPSLITEAACTAARLRTRWYAVYVTSPDASDRRVSLQHRDALHQNVKLAGGLGATIVRIDAAQACDGLFGIARREGITHLMVSENGQARWAALWRLSAGDSSLSRVTDTAVIVVPTGVGALDENGVGAFEVEPSHHTETRLGIVTGLKRPVQWGLALVGTSAMFILHAPALLCFAAATGLAVWWCRALDAESP
jgi:K+-sensing histidine kinase KdpD